MATENTTEFLRFPGWVIDAARQQGVDYGQLRAAPDSSYSCLMPYQMDQVSKIYAAEVREAPATILDATANVGCDTIQFCRMFPDAEVTAVEVDPKTAKLLRLNMNRLASILGRDETHRVEVLDVDCAELLAAPRRFDLVYFDPPWGGPEYQEAASLHLMLSGRPLGDIVGAALARVAPLAVVKAPVNVDLDRFAEEAARALRGPVDLRVYDVVKPKANRKGAVAYRLVFVRADASARG